jgi:hypothetical protein
MTAATSAASTPVASNTHTSPRRFLRGGWPPAEEGWASALVGRGSALVGRGSALVGWARKAAAVGVRCGCALVIVAGPLVLPAGGGT